MVAKELLMGIAVYNLILALMALGTAVIGQSPRQMSFSQSLSIVKVFMAQLARARTDNDSKCILEKMLRFSRYLACPKNKNISFTFRGDN